MGLLKAALEFAEMHRWQVDEILASAGIPRSLLVQARGRLTEDQAVAVVQAMWRSTGDELFGLGSHPLPRGSTRLVGYALISAADLEEALTRLRQSLAAVPAIPLQIELRDEGAAITLRGSAGHSPVPAFIAIVAVHRLLSWLVRRDLEPLSIEVALPRPSDPDWISFAFDRPLIFDSDQTGLVLSRRSMRLPVSRDATELEELLRESPRMLLRRPRYDSALANQVRRILEVGALRRAIPDAVEIARRISVSPQTLRRKLAAEGTSVRTLSNEVRRDVAIHRLVDGRESVAALSERLGYSEPSAFSRAFRSWTGSTPQEYRRGNQSGSE